MIFTDSFVYVHQPKTGGTTVSAALFRLYGARWNLLTRLLTMSGRDLVTRGKYGTFAFNRNKHGGCSEIPEAHRHKQILASVRNPYDLHVSEYEFGWWKRSEFLSYYRAVPEFEKRFPGFPDLGFEQYLELTGAAFRTLANDRLGPGDELGAHTEQFVKFYFKDPAAAFARIDDDYVASGRWREDMHAVRFLRTDRLTEDLHAFLLERGFEPEDIAFIREMGKVLPQGKGRASGQRWERYYTPELKARVRRRDRLVFAIFPEFE